MKIAFDSDEANEVNKKIFETIYYACMNESCQIARKKYFQYKKILSDNGTVDIVTGYRIRRKYDSIECEEKDDAHELCLSLIKQYPKDIELLLIRAGLCYSMNKKSVIKIVFFIAVALDYQISLKNIFIGRFYYVINS